MSATAAKSIKKVAMSDALQAVGILPILVLIVIVFSFVAPNFMTEANMMNSIA